MNTLKLGDLDFLIHRSKKRTTVGITVERNGDLLLHAPQNASIEDLERIVNKKKTWIYTKLAEKVPFIQLVPKKEYVSGEGFFYLGKSYRLMITDTFNTPSKLRLHQSRFEMHRGDRSKGRDLFIKWYSEHLRPVLNRHLSWLAPRVPIEFKSVHIRDLGYNWATCGKNRDLYFHWRVAMLPHRMIEYIVTHELVHLVEKKHSSVFWSKVETMLPDCGERIRWLAENGAFYNI